MIVHMRPCRVSFIHSNARLGRVALVTCQNDNALVVYVKTPFTRYILLKLHDCAYDSKGRPLCVISRSTLLTRAARFSSLHLYSESPYFSSRT